MAVPFRSGGGSRHQALQHHAGSVHMVNYKPKIWRPEGVILLRRCSSPHSIPECNTLVLCTLMSGGTCPVGHTLQVSYSNPEQQIAQKRTREQVFSHLCVTAFVVTATTKDKNMASWARPIRDGEYTSVIYGLIREGRLIEAASALADCSRRQGALGSRAALSLLAFCHYQAQEFEQAASCYEQLCTLCPEEPRYALSRAQALYQSGQAYDEALQVAAALAEDKPEMAPAARQLQAAIRYAQDDLAGARALLLQGGPSEDDNADTQVNLGCLAYKEGRPDEALRLFNKALQSQADAPPQLWYAVALCHYARRDYAPALQQLAHIIERGIRDRPELSVGMATEGLEEPPEAFGNLLLLCCRLEQHPLAADLLAEHAALTYRLLPPFLYEFLEALLAQQTAPEEAYAKLEALAARQADRLRQMRQQGAPQAQCEAVLRERFLPALMAQARIPWEAHDYPLVERLFRRSVELCSEEDCWRLNVGHVLFVQEGKFHEAVAFYEPLVERQQDRDLLRLRPALLANLCVAYIMTGQNEQAEQLMRRVEQREEQLAYDQPGEKIFHLCIVNLVIGTLYCAKGNYDFGISRVIKSFEPHASKLGADTWYYAKRCLLALFESLAKQVVLVRDAVLYDLLKFLEQCEQHGRTLPSATDIRPTPAGLGSRSVAYEARRLRALTLRLMAAEPNAFRNR
ncbi:tetratricopeptide repeat domain 30 isoform X2 [Rhipicephalus microplus]|uniref:tetratricopeptide repeat domain 30 isoform X2 n=1 Tax=Rhipicephalus microplus TaxID=6941 RepID=UPI003F6C1EA7